MQAMHASALAVISAMVSLPASSGIGDEWFARSELGPEPTCALFGRAAVEPRMSMSISIVWTSTEGALLWLNGSLSGKPSVRLESVGTADQWSVTFDKRGEPGYAARHVVISAGDLDKLIDNLGRGHELAITVTYGDGLPTRYSDTAHDRALAVAMYRACVKSLSENPPPRYSHWPGMYLFQIVDDEECGFRHIFSDRDFSPFITLWSGATSGRISFERQTIETT